MDQNSKNNGGIDLSEGAKFQDAGWWQAMEQRQNPETSKIIRLAIKLSGGLLKTEKQATYVLFGFVAMAIIISLFLFFGGGEIPGRPEYIKILPAEI